VNQIGRSERPIREGSEEKMREEYERVIKAGVMSGSIILLDDTGKIAAQHSSFADEKTRHGRTEDGSPYEPPVIERGHPNFDLTSIADAIKAQPETDPDDDPEEPSSSEATSGDVEVRAKDLEERLKEVEAALASKGKVEATKKPYEPPKVQGPFRSGDGHKEAEPRMPPPRGERMRGQPCGGGLTGLLSFLQAANVYYSQMQASQRRIARRHRRFGFEMLIRLISGAPVCESTVHASYSDAQEATRM